MVIVSVEIQTAPRVPPETRVSIDDLGDAAEGIMHVALRFGYAETPDVPAGPATLTPEQTEGRLDLDATYFLSKIELRAGNQKGMAPSRKRCSRPPPTSPPPPANTSACLETASSSSAHTSTCSRSAVLG